MAGLITIRLQGPDSLLAWVLIAIGLASLVPFVAYEKRQVDPIIDVRLFASPLQWPVQLTAFLFGMSVLGAQIPLSTFARTDPDAAGYGLGADASFVATLIGVYVVFLAIGAFTLPLTTRLLGARGALIMSSLLVALGYALWLPFHDTTGQALVNMAVAGVGLRRAGRRAAGQCRRGRAARTHRLRHRHDQRDQDHGRRHRLLDLRHRPGLDRLARGPDRGPRPALRLPHRLVGLLGRRPARGRRAAADAQGRHHDRASPGRRAGVSARRRSRLGARLLILVLAALGVLLLLLAFSRPSVGRFLAAGLVLGGAAVVRYNAVHRDDPGRYGRAAQVRSLVWSVVIVVVFVGVSLLISELLSD